MNKADVWAVGSIDIGQGVEPFIERLQPGPLFSDGFESGDTSLWTVTLQ